MPVLRTLCALLLCTSVGLSAELRTLTGQKISGQLVSASDTEVEISTATGMVKTPVAKVLDIVLQPVKAILPDTKRIDFELSDGTQLHCKPDGLTIKGTKVELTLLSGQTVKVEIKDIAHFLRDAQDTAVRKKFADMMKRKEKNDRLLVLAIDEETKKPYLNRLSGTIGDADETGETIQFRSTDGKKIPAKLNKVHGMIFFRPNPNPLPTVCQIHDVAGNMLMANKVAVDKTGYKITTATGATVAYDAEGVARLDYNINKLNYLSDLVPIKVVERSGSGLVTHYRQDKNLDNDAIRIKGKVYPRGLSMHAYTELEYDLKGKYKEFRFIPGVDDQVGGNSKALVTVYCDGTKVYSQEITRQTGSAEPKPVIVKVKDVENLKIVVSSKNLLDLHDHVTLADAKVSQ